MGLLKTTLQGTALAGYRTPQETAESLPQLGGSSAPERLVFLPPWS